MQVDGRPEVKLEITIKITEVEARALEALGSYSVDTFVKHFYEFLGKTYMEPYEKGLRSFLAGTSGLNTWLSRVDNARKEFVKP